MTHQLHQLIFHELANVSKSYSEILLKISQGNNVQTVNFLSKYNALKKVLSFKLDFFSEELFF